MTYYSDGFCYEQNPSPIGGGFTICDEQGNVILREERRRENFTSNEAELLGVVHAILIASHGDRIVTDSKVARAWVITGKTIARPDLDDKAKLARKMITLKKLTVDWESRETNLAGHVNEELNKKFKKHFRKYYPGGKLYNQLMEERKDKL